jgi:hypothetical protein
MDRNAETGRIERRKESRYAADTVSYLYADGVGEPVVIKNISSYGALLKGRYFPSVGTRVELIADGLDVEGTVIWLGPDQCGVLLAHAVDPRTILQTSTAPPEPTALH